MDTVRCRVCGIEGDSDETALGPRGMLYCEVCEFWLCDGACCIPHLDQDAERHVDHRRINSPN